jgi:hypothetical protein
MGKQPMMTAPDNVLSLITPENRIVQGQLIQAKAYELRAIGSCRIKADENNYDRAQWVCFE